MHSCKVIIAFESSDTTEKLKNILAEGGYQVLATASSGNEVIRKATTLYPDLLILGFKFKDMNLIEIYNSLQGTVEFLSIVPLSYREIIDEEIDVFTLSLPISKNLVYNTIDIIFQSKKKTLKLQDRIKKLELTIEERKIIEKAKGKLMKIYNFSEEEAFKFLQKNSMNTSNKMVEVAKKIIET